MKLSIKVITKFTVAVFTVVMLGGCQPVLDFFKKNNPTYSKKTDEKISQIKAEKDGIILLNVDGKPAINEEDFNKYLMQMLQANPYFRGASAESLPKTLKRKFFDELIKQELIIAWAEKNNVDKSAEFKKNFTELMKLVKRSLLVQEYEKELSEKINVTDSEIKDHFNKNKEKFIKEPGSVSVQGVEFADSTAANKFLNDIKGKEFKVVANADFKKEYKDFGKMTQQPIASDTPIAKEIKDKAFAIKKFPSNEIVKLNDKVWVVNFVEKTEPKYFAFDEIKGQLSEMLKGNKFREILETKVDKLRKEFTVDVNEDYFNDSEANTDEVDSDSSSKASGTAA